MDKARIQTNKKLNKMEREIGRIYKDDPALKHIQKEYADYMKMVQKETKSSYEAYINETDRDVKEDLKKTYMEKVRALTINSPKYRKLIERITSVLAKVNQRALDVSNKAMREIYTINYNQVAEECVRVGIKVNG